MNEKLEELEEIVAYQSNITILWSVPEERPWTLQETMLMAALRHLHAVIEGDEFTARLAKEGYWNIEEEL